VASQQKLSTKSVRWPTSSVRLGRSRPCAAGLAHLVCMKTNTHPETELGSVLTLSQLALELGQCPDPVRPAQPGPRTARVPRRS
jgi:hypothetical protein